MDNKKKTVAHRYAQLESERHTFLERGRDASELTLPTLLPPQGHSSATVYKTPYQSVGARGVNNLASKLLMTLLPPNSPFFRLTIDDFDIEELAGRKDARGAVEEALARLERTAQQDIEALAVRVPIHEALKQLIVTGNALVYMPQEGGMKVYRLDRYVVKRDTMGNVMEIITKESVSPQVLPKAAQDIIYGEGNNYNKEDITNAKDCDLYTHVCRRGDKFDIHQEVKGVEIPKTRGSYPAERLPFIPLRFTRIDGEDYGRGYVEEYIGDLRSLEALTRAIVEGAAASAKVLFLVRPNGTTKQRVLSQAPNGGIVSGDSNDVSTLQVQKQGDFRVAQETSLEIGKRLSFAFLLNNSVQRKAERVTAEEVRFMAQELETALGGVYSILSMEFQRPFVNLLLARLEQQGKMPKMAKDTVKPQIVTGLEALGRGQDLSKLAQLLQYLQPLGQDVISQELNVADYIDRLAASLGIDTGGLIKSPEQRQAEQQASQQANQQAMMQEAMKNMAERAAPNLAERGMDYLEGQQQEMEN